VETTKFKIEDLQAMIVENNPAFGETGGLKADTDLMDSGAIDSYSIIQLIQSLEEKLDIVFDYSDLRAFNFKNLETLMVLLRTKYGVK
jgi:acyl carrier protein